MLARDHYAIVPAEDMWRLLAANRSELHTLFNLWDEAMPQLDERGAEVYQHKRTLVSYYDLGASVAAFEGPRRASGHSGAGGRMVEHIDPTTEHEVSNFRLHKPWPRSTDANSLVHAFQRLIVELLTAPGELRGLVGEATGGAGQSWEAMMTAFRVTSGPARLGEPGPEGVHQDSAALTVVSLAARRNVANHSGQNRVWSLEQPCGKPAVGDLRSARLLASLTLLEPLDTLLVLDRRVKHEVAPFEQQDIAAGDAVRDVLTFEVRIN